MPSEAASKATKTIHAQLNHLIIKKRNPINVIKDMFFYFTFRFCTFEEVFCHAFQFFSMSSWYKKKVVTVGKGKHEAVLYPSLSDAWCGIFS